VNVMWTRLSVCEKEILSQLLEPDEIGSRNKMAEVGSDFFGTDIVRQLMLTKTSTLMLMTTGVLLFVAKRFLSKQSDVITSSLTYRPICTYWFCILFLHRWGQSLSKLVGLTTGVRQGGARFDVYVNDIFTRVGSSVYGWEISGKCVGILMYADDLLLISTTCNGLSRFVNKKWNGWICSSVLVSHLWSYVDRDTIKSVPTYF